ncbi:amino acid ABC transporter permease [Gulosibacter molinativorax]|uniref:Amino acid ABC transporter permease n=1 Tax=Gulosibacter molinativorax TaxID=256821 RepID=A0ABT7C7J8_9MICO|nr:amino acid ABC transporter permease [Gulosibacter molinativorax]MDJ1371165.1 amino acid ABC transporter permease [Gulosibacter molinativorax]QUY62981.1 Amino acid ABC transporter permease protein [Gulosibacter molinativorax]
METFLAILQGVPATLGITIFAFVIGVVLGVPLALARRSSFFPLSWLSIAVIEILRGIPPVVWLFIIFFGVGRNITGLSPFTAAVIGMGIYSAAYMAEIYRGGFRAVDSGQWEASRALGIGPSWTMRDIIGPQVVRQSVPAAATYAIGLIKDSSIAYVIGVNDIVFYANEQSRQNIDALGPFLIAAAVYVALTIPTAWATRKLDAVLQTRGAK